MCDLRRGKDEQEPASARSPGRRPPTDAEPPRSLLVLGDEQEMLDKVFFCFPPKLLPYGV